MDFKNQKAIYLQIAEHIMDQILSGQYPEDGKLPSVREYATDVEVNVNTVARSFEWLQNQNIVVKRRGLGNFVSPGAREMVMDGCQLIILRRIIFMQIGKMNGFICHI